MRLVDRFLTLFGVHRVGGFTVVVDNTRQDISTTDVLARLEESLALIEAHQPWRLAHLRRDLKQIRVMRFPCRGAYFANQRTCMVELTFLARRDIGAETVASTIVHEGMHARVDVMCSRLSASGSRKSAPADRVRSADPRSREERLCRRAELEFGESLPAALGAPVVARARASLTLGDEEVAPAIDWAIAEERMRDADHPRKA